MAFSSPYLAGNFAPVTDETTIAGLTVDGTLPATLDGQYLRLGPNPAHWPDEPYEWRNTDVMVHAVEIRQGRAVSYRNRWILTPHVAGVLGIGPPTAELVCCEQLAVVGRSVLAAGRSGVAYEISEHLVSREVRPVAVPDADRCLGDITTNGHAHHPLLLRDGATVGTGAGLVLTSVVGPEVVDPSPQGWMTASASPERFVYTLTTEGDPPFAGTTVHKQDLHRRWRGTFDFGTGRHPGELAFVPDQRRLGHEDGGWLIGFVHDDVRATDDLVVLDAQHLDDGPVATVRLPRRVPYGWHGLWRSR
jgi:hypothetical protein